LKIGVITEAKNDNADAYRCLSCNTLCEICADVCPNRANVTVEVDSAVSGTSIQGTRQIVHIDHMCNECGNCATFCPHAGKPYREKFTVFSNEADFTDSENSGFLKISESVYKIRTEDKSTVIFRKGGEGLPDSWIKMIEIIEKKYGYLLTQEETSCC
jgi:putative selenate reductase